MMNSIDEPSNIAMAHTNKESPRPGTPGLLLAGAPAFGELVAVPDSAVAPVSPGLPLSDVVDADSRSSAR